MENITLVEFNAFTISGDVSLGLKCSEALGILRIHNSKIASRSFSPMLSNICTNLKKLEISHTDLSLHGVGVEGGIVFPSLEAFKLVNCQISDLNLNSLLSGFRPAALKSIQLWDIGQHLLHGNDFILTSALNFPRLEMISLGFPGINDQTVISMLSNNRGLEYLRLNYFDCTLEGIGPSALDFSNLEILELAFSPHLTEAGFSGVLAKVGRKLEILRVNHTRITLEGAVAVSGPFPNLRELNISECQHISNDAFLAFLNKTGEKLEELNLSSTNITLSQIQTVTKPLPCLTELDLSFCHRVDMTGLIGLLRKTRHGADFMLDIIDTSLSQEVLQEYFPDIDYRY